MTYSGMLRELPRIRWLVGHAGGAIPWLMERMDNGYRDFAEFIARPPRLLGIEIAHGDGFGRHLCQTQTCPTTRPSQREESE